jgi:SAM-dependent methyltransferase
MHSRKLSRFERQSSRKTALLLMARELPSHIVWVYARPDCMVQIYREPSEYNLEHLGDEADIRFYVRLARTLKPRSILELACGTGRISVPLAKQGAHSGFLVVGLDCEARMLKEARAKIRRLPSETRHRIRLVRGDMRRWLDRGRFDLVIVPCASITHLLDLRDQLSVWRHSYENLAPGGRFVVDTTMPNFAAYADSFANPPRTLIEVDRDVTDDVKRVRLVRRRTVSYLPDEQRAKIRFLYEKYRRKKVVESRIDDFESHVYFPRELQLLFIHTGFEMEHIFGDYERRPLRANSQQVIMIARKPIEV